MENPWTGDILWEKTSTLSSKPPSTDNSHQEAHRTSWRMAIASYEDRSDPESLRIEITETDHPIVGRKRDRTKNNEQ
jgi:hypothetical protein